MFLKSFTCKVVQIDTVLKSVVILSPSKLKDMTKENNYFSQLPAILCYWQNRKVLVLEESVMFFFI